MSIRALVTGGAGFIGSHLAQRLIREGMSVRIFDNFSSGNRSNLENFESEVEWIEGDIRDREAVGRAARGVDCIWHQAALASVPRSIADPLLTHEVNVTGTLNVLDAAREASVHKVILASSSSVYGESPVLPKVESMPTVPLSPYAVHKLVNELYASQFALHYGMSATCLRYFNIFGPRQDPESPYAAVLPCFIKRIRQGLPPKIYGDGTQTRDFTYVENAVEANLLAYQSRQPGCGVFNIASGKQYTVLRLAEAVVEWLGWQEGIEFVPQRPGDIHHSYADISQADRILNYKPVVSFEEGLRRTLSWFSENPV